MYTNVYVTKAAPFARAQSTSKRLDSLLRKRERWGPGCGDLDRDIKNAEYVLDTLLIEAGNEALESLKALLDDLNELKDRIAAGYLSAEQIDQAEAIKSPLETILGIDEQSYIARKSNQVLRLSEWEPNSLQGPGLK